MGMSQFLQSFPGRVKEKPREPQHAWEKLISISFKYFRFGYKVFIIINIFAQGQGKSTHQRELQIPEAAFKEAGFTRIKTSTV